MRLPCSTIRANRHAEAAERTQHPLAFRDRAAVTGDYTAQGVPSGPESRAAYAVSSSGRPRWNRGRT